jgi:tetratricopeptide (TPR) repeat protein
MARLFAGDAAGAMEPFERGLGLNPHDPQNFVWYTLLAFARYFAGEPEKALQAIERAASIRPAGRTALELAACCHLGLGRAERTAECLAQARRLPAPTDRLLEPLKAGALWREWIARLPREIS